MSAAEDNRDEIQRTDEVLKQMGARIKALRKEKGFTNADYFAYAHNISRAQYQRYENGQDLRFSSLVRLTDAFGMTLKDFFSEGFEQ
jgi:transcriptional regulator with XRE-family HTH domain